jgi:hypothetical protein
MAPAKPTLWERHGHKHTVRQLRRIVEVVLRAREKHAILN